jgi:hypothetical protein
MNEQAEYNSDVIGVPLHFASIEMHNRKDEHGSKASILYNLKKMAPKAMRLLEHSSALDMELYQYAADLNRMRLDQWREEKLLTETMRSLTARSTLFWVDTKSGASNEMC